MYLGPIDLGVASCHAREVSPPHPPPRKGPDPMARRKPIEQNWRDLARKAAEEKDPEKLLDLAQQVLEKYDEEQRRLRRIA